jgi:tryptophan synthase alpha chain
VSTALTAALAARRDGGAKLLVAYLMAGSTPDWVQTAASLVDAGVDALEVGLAFSDPIIDGPVIQAAATRALDRSTTVASALAELATVDLGVPLVAMTYLNVVARNGYEATSVRLAEAGCTGVILPDLPLEELDRWHAAARPAGLATVLLAAPSSTPARLDVLCARSEGFVYAVGRMATTGETDRLDPRGIELVGALRSRTTLPVCLGVGVSTPAHATEATRVADGVVVGSAIVRRMLEGATPREVGAFAASLRHALDDQGS